MPWAIIILMYIIGTMHIRRVEYEYQTPQVIHREATVIFIE